MGPIAQHRESGQNSLTSRHPNAGALPQNVVVGLGNEIAGDDGVGIAAARELERVLAGRADIDVIALPWAGFALLDVLRGRTRAAIIDCLATGDHPPGTVVPITESDLAGSVRLNSFHDISYPTVMSLGREMGWDMPDSIAIWGIEADFVGVFVEGMSPLMAPAIERVVAEVTEFIGAKT